MQDVPQFIAEKNKLYGQAFVLLVEIDLGEGTFARWARTDEGDDILFEGNTFLHIPMGNPSRSQGSRGEISTFDLQIANPKRIFQSVLHSTVVEGCAGRLITVHRDHLADPTAKTVERFTVVAATSTRQQITLSCRGLKFNPMRTRIPRRTMTRTNYPGLVGNGRPRYY